MFGTSYRYFEGSDGRHYCFAIEPSFTCPSVREADDEKVIAAAAELGVDAKWLARRLQHHPVRLRDDRERLTDTCGTCGVRLKRLGFRWWIEGPPKDVDVNTAASSRINQRLGGDGFVMVEGPWYTSRKKDARTMALGRSKAS